MVNSSTLTRDCTRDMYLLKCKRLRLSRCGLEPEVRHLVTSLVAVDGLAHGHLEHERRPPIPSLNIVRAVLLGELLSEESRRAARDEAVLWQQLTLHEKLLRLVVQLKDRHHVADGRLAGVPPCNVAQPARFDHVAKGAHLRPWLCRAIDDSAIAHDRRLPDAKQVALTDVMSLAHFEPLGGPQNLWSKLTRRIR